MLGWVATLNCLLVKVTMVVSVLYVSMWPCDGLAACPGCTPPQAQWLLEIGFSSIPWRNKQVKEMDGWINQFSLSFRYIRPLLRKIVLETFYSSKIWFLNWIFLLTVESERSFAGHKNILLGVRLLLHISRWEEPLKRVIIKPPGSLPSPSLDTPGGLYLPARLAAAQLLCSPFSYDDPEMDRVAAENKIKCAHMFAVRHIAKVKCIS